MIKGQLKPALRSQRGSITLDFIFAFVLVMGLSGILFALSMTMTVSSITQYITFASARSYFAGHIRPDSQQDLAKRKFDHLVQNRVFAPLYNNGWFEIVETIPQSPVNESISSRFQEYGEKPENNTFFGVYVDFNAKMLNFKIPFLGSTTDNDNSFTAVIGSYLSREPAASECQDFNRQRWDAIQRIGGGRYSGHGGNYLAISDNGC